MIPSTPEQWLDRLAGRLDADRVRFKLLRRYITGDAPLPEGATDAREAYRRWQHLARTDFANLIVDAVAERLTVTGFMVGDQAQDNDAARTLWRVSRMDSASADVHRDMLVYGRAFAMATPVAGGAVLTRESPLATIVDSDPLVPGLVRAGLKTWVDMDTQYAVVHLPGEVHRFVRDRVDPLSRLSGGWRLEESAGTGLDVVPVVEFRNRDSRGEFALHLDLLDRINWVLLQRLLIIAMQAFRQRALEGDLPERDEKGDLIDYEAIFTPGPDALWTLPDGVSIWESTPGDIQQILSAVKDDIRDLSAATRTPMSVLSPDSANQSAQGAALSREGLVFKVEDRQRRATPSWEALVSMGLGMTGEALPVRVQWAPAERQSLAEKADAAVKLAQTLPWRRVMSDVLGYAADDVDLMELDRAGDALALMLGEPAGGAAVA